MSKTKTTKTKSEDKDHAWFAAPPGGKSVLESAARDATLRDG